MLLVSRTGRPSRLGPHIHLGDPGIGRKFAWLGLSEEETRRSLGILSKISSKDFSIWLRCKGGEWIIEALGRIRLIVRSPKLSDHVSGISFRTFKELSYLEGILPEKEEALLQSVLSDISGTGVWRHFDLEDGVVILSEIVIREDRIAPDYIVSALKKGVKFDWGILSIY